MYERMRDKNKKTTFDEMLGHSGTGGKLWLLLEQFLEDNYNITKLIRFPFGNSDGWGVKYSHGKKWFCDITAEKGAFVVLFTIGNKDIDKVKEKLSPEALKACNDKYPCGDGGWVRLRVLNKIHLADAENLLAAKIKPKG